MPSNLAEKYGGDEKDSHLWGGSFYKAILGCPKRYFCERENDPDGGEDAAFGTRFHTWLPRYHKWIDEPLPALDPEPLSEKTISEVTLAERYARRFSPQGFGSAIAVEQTLFMEVEIAGKLYPFRGTLDAIVDITAEHALLLRVERGIIVDPGRYLVDHKTKKQRSQTIVTQYLSDPQFTGYYRLWEHHTGEKLMGTLANILFKYKDDKPEGFMTLIIPPPDDTIDAIWRGIVKDGFERYQQFGPDHMNPIDACCFAYFRKCPCFDDCPRTNLE
jgi:hypothetical protein